jgi:hypothetical protein
VPSAAALCSSKSPTGKTSPADTTTASFDADLAALLDSIVVAELPPADCSTATSPRTATTVTTHKKSSKNDVHHPARAASSRRTQQGGDVFAAASAAAAGSASSSGSGASRPRAPPSGISTFYLTQRECVHRVIQLCFSRAKDGRPSHLLTTGYRVINASDGRYSGHRGIFAGNLASVFPNR